TAPEPLGRFVGDLPAAKWVQVRIPMARLRSASVYEFIPEQLQSVVFLQGAADAAEHTLIVDQVHVGDESLPSSALYSRPVRLTAKGYERHVVLQWDDEVESPGLAHYVIYRSQDGGAFAPIGIQLPGTHRFVDWLGRPGVTARYLVAGADWENHASA